MVHVNDVLSFGVGPWTKVATLMTNFSTLVNRIYRCVLTSFSKFLVFSLTWIFVVVILIKMFVHNIFSFQRHCRLLILYFCLKLMLIPVSWKHPFFREFIFVFQLFYALRHIDWQHNVTRGYLSATWPTKYM